MSSKQLGADARLLIALGQVLEVAGARPGPGLIHTAARQHSINAEELRDRLLVVLLAAHAARRWLKEDAEAAMGPRRKAAA